MWLRTENQLLNYETTFIISDQENMEIIEQHPPRFLFKCDDSFINIHMIEQIKSIGKGKAEITGVIPAELGALQNRAVTSIEQAKALIEYAQNECKTDFVICANEVLNLENVYRIAKLEPLPHYLSVMFTYGYSQMINTTINKDQIEFMFLAEQVKYDVHNLPPYFFENVNLLNVSLIESLNDRLFFLSKARGRLLIEDPPQQILAWPRLKTAENRSFLINPFFVQEIHIGEWVKVTVRQVKSQNVYQFIGVPEHGSIEEFIEQIAEFVPLFSFHPRKFRPLGLYISFYRTRKQLIALSLLEKQKSALPQENTLKLKNVYTWNDIYAVFQKGLKLWPVSSQQPPKG